MELTVTRRADARIAVAGTAPASTMAHSFLRAELDGVRVVDLASASDGLDDALRDCDVLVFVANAGDLADETLTAALGDAARTRGILIAAVVVTPETSFGRSSLLGALRDTADMVMIVRDVADVHAVVAALR